MPSKSAEPCSYSKQEEKTLRVFIKPISLCNVDVLCPTCQHHVLRFSASEEFNHVENSRFLSCCGRTVPGTTVSLQSCRWVGLTHGLGWVELGRDFSVFGGLGWVHYSKSTKNLNGLF